MSSESSITDLSPVFADMHALPQRPGSDAPTFQLTDQEYERAAVIRIFLNLITCQTNQLPFSSPYTEWRLDLESLLYFLDKYDSQPALKQLRLYGAEAALHRLLETTTRSYLQRQRMIWRFALMSSPMSDAEIMVTTSSTPGSFEA